MAEGEELSCSLFSWHAAKDQGVPLFARKKKEDHG
jgi:hypothetical protein